VITRDDTVFADEVARWRNDGRIDESLLDVALDAMASAIEPGALRALLLGSRAPRRPVAAEGLPSRASRSGYPAEQRGKGPSRAKVLEPTGWEAKAEAPDNSGPAVVGGKERKSITVTSAAAAAGEPHPPPPAALAG
jgi:hypothetical protein